MRMLVSSKPRLSSPRIRVVQLRIDSFVEVPTECVDIQLRCIPCSPSKVRTGYEATRLADRHQLTDTAPIARDRVGLPTLQGVHDLLRPHAQVALADLGTRAHLLSIATCSTACYMVSRPRAPGPTGDPDAPRCGRVRPGPSRPAGRGTAGAARHSGCATPCAAGCGRRWSAPRHSRARRRWRAAVPPDRAAAAGR